MRLKDKQIQFWYLMPNSKELKKFEVDILPITIFASVFLFFLLIFFLSGFFFSSNAISQTKKHFSYMLGNIKVRNLKEEKEFLKRKNSFLETELARIIDANKKYTEYELNISKRNAELANLIENTTKMNILKSDSYVRQSGIDDDISKAPLGGSEVNFNRLDSSFVKGSFNVSDFDNIRRYELIRQMDRINKTVEVLPIGLPLKTSRVSSGFGIRTSPFTGKKVKHLGIDFAASYGTPVRATGKGVVVKAKYSDTYGYMVDIRHKRHLVSRYAHLSRILTKEGSVVSRGDLIGLVGSTGRSTGNHLHYELKVNKKAVNPIAFIELASYLESTASSICTARR